jgi:septum formation protein
MNVILASASPRRHQLLKMIGLEHQVIPANVDENVESDMNAVQTAEHLAQIKGHHVASSHPGNLIISADTIVVTDQGILGKPVDEQHAFEMLRYLSGRTHTVITGVALAVSKNGTLQNEIFHESTLVTFDHLSDNEILAYIKTGSPFDKAGSYGIQDDLGSLFVKRIEGDYYNVVGLPVQHLYRKLKSFYPAVASGLLGSV